MHKCDTCTCARGTGVQKPHERIRAGTGKAAGARASKSSLEIENLLKEFRKVSIEESKKQFILL
ncbi:hypothetical protein [Flavobacterium ajazii]|uniref:hypothetical protein n=1 Tax=Flavobacterium ajazii TaxID=2692318 RepID=UPI0013D71378|nr:hypothetical protein [Flavobacterium ajazii]